jgi:hypothetical protein
MANLTITATVDDADLERFLELDAEIRECFGARLSEVFGDDGAVLSTVQVWGVEISD